ncbi:MAG TPA: hypothetical protein VK066_16810 [Chloroflexota bacterium]|nr:hypothetical protein [Chloroflexota bacterium]
MDSSDEQAAQRDQALAHLREALARVQAAHQEVRRWAPLSVMNDFVAIEAELRTILARL